MASKRWKRRLVACAVVLVFAALWMRLTRTPFPSDRTPEGSYARIVLSVTDGKMKDMFPYLETEAQWASYTIGEMRRKASARIRASYPEPERSELLQTYAAEADAPDGSDVFAIVADQRNWAARMRKDLSGTRSVETEGERATIVTARGTRYPFRRRENGIWGLTIFTSDLIAESERASRDLAVVEKAADDYDHAKEATK